MADSKETEDTEVVSFRVESELVEQFMLAYRSQQAENNVPATGGRSDAMRQLMRAFVNNPEIIKYGQAGEEIED